MKSRKTFLAATTALALSLAAVTLPARDAAAQPVTGLYVGALVGIVALFAVPRSHVTFSRARPLLIIAGLPTLVTVGTAALGLWDPANALRAALALPLGFVVGAIVAAVLARRLR